MSVQNINQSDLMIPMRYYQNWQHEDKDHDIRNKNN